MHTWHTAGELRNYVEHSSREDGQGSDRGGFQQDVLGPFASAPEAGLVAMALNDAYRAGRLDGRTALLEQQARDWPSAHGSDDGEGQED